MVPHVKLLYVTGIAQVHRKSHHAEIHWVTVFNVSVCCFAACPALADVAETPLSPVMLNTMAAPQIAYRDGLQIVWLSGSDS